jgi:hypothetical protein
VVKKGVFMHLRILPDHQNHGLKKKIFKCLKWLKTCFDSFAHNSRPPGPWPEKKIFFVSKKLPNVF